MELSVIIPAKNEAQNIERTLRSTIEYLHQKNIDHEILVVTNRSNDGTVSIVQTLAKHLPTIRLVDFPHMGGKGFAVRQGMLEAHGKYRLFMDADNSTTIDHIEKMMPYFDRGYDVVIGSIRAPGHQVASGSEQWYRILLGRLSNIFTQIIILPGIGDTQRGFKVFTARAAEDIFKHSRINQFAFDIEVLALARRFGYKIKEVPIRWQNNEATSHVGLSSYVQVLKDTLRIRWDLFTGKYPRATMASRNETAHSSAERI